MQIECFPDAPAEWPRKVFADIAGVNPKYGLKKSTDYPFIEMAAVAENFGGIISFDYRKADASGLARFKVGDILFGKITPCAENGKVALVKDLPLEFGLGSTEFIVLSPCNGNDRRFVYAIACANPVHGRAVSRMEGSTGRLRVTEDVFTKWLVVAAPPEPEQRAIADILNEVDAAIERTRTAIEKARRLKRGLMQRFFEVALGPISSADRPGRRVKPGWRLLPTGSLLDAEPKNGYSPECSPQPPGYPTFSIGAVRNGKIDLKNHEHLKYSRISDALAEKFAVRKGDILIVRGNANPDLVGKCGVIDEFPTGCIYSDILKRVSFRDTDDGVMPTYAALVWNHFLVHNQVLKLAKTSNGTLKINSRDVKRIVMPVPPRNEQIRLVDMVQAAEDQIQTIIAKLRSLERLKRGLMQDLLTGKRRVPVTNTADTNTMAKLQPA